MNKLIFLIIIALLILITCCENAVKIEGTYVEFTKIEKVKKQIKKGDEKYFPAYKGNL
jgi:hypothetical protein